MATENTKSKQPTNAYKKKRQRYLPHNRPVKKGAYPLRPGVQGFFITCDGGKERQASQEAINVIDSFYEELVDGTVSSTENAELTKKPMNKKIKFDYSDSSSSDDDDKDDSGSDGDVDQQNEGDQPKLDADRGSHNTDGSLINAEPLGKEGEISSSSEKQTQENTEKDENKTKKQEDVSAAEPPHKKQCLVPSRCQNIRSYKNEEKSIDKLIEAELAELGDKNKRRFSYSDTGCNGVVFVQMRKRDGDPSPKSIVQHMMTSLASSKKHVSRFMLRVLPVEIACYASDEEITRSIKPLIAQYFPEETQTPHKFAVLYDARANTGIDRMKIINAVAKAVPPPHKVDLNNPEINIVVQIIKTVCLIGIVEKYKELAKYNIRQLTSSNN